MQIKKVTTWLHDRINNRKNLKVLNESALLEKTESLIGSYLLIIIISLFLFFLIIWATLTQVDEVARSNGEIIPAKNIQKVKNQFPGVISNINITNGTRVQKNQVLITLNPTTIKAERDKVIIQLISITANKIRNKALLNNKSISTLELLSQIKKEIDLSSIKQNEISNLLEDKALLSKIQQQSDISEINIIEDQIEKHSVELQFLKQRMHLHKDLLKVIKEELGVYDTLKKKDLASKRELLAIKRQYIRINKEYVSSLSEYEKEKSTLHELQNKLKQAKNINELDLAVRLNEMNTDLLKYKKQLVKLNEQLSSLNIKAPISGIIKGLNLGPGSVIAANQEILSIVPTDSKMIVETKISSKDIGHIKVGANVKIKVATYDYIRFGMLTGKLSKISASTFHDNQSKVVYYKGIVELDREYIGTQDKQYPLLPGMIAEVDIYTGKKTILDYLLKPIYVSLHYSFSER